MLKHFIVAILLACINSSLMAKVLKHERALIVVSELDSNGYPELEPLYTILEQLTQVTVKGMLSHKYAEIKILNNEHATFPNFKQTVRDLASREDIKAIDVIMSLHGLPEQLVFKDKFWSLAEMEKDFLSAYSYSEGDLVSILKKKLRIMYNLSCYGASHNPFFYRMGFDVSTGSVDVNANSEVEFFPALAAWKKGIAFKTSFSLSNNPVMLYIADEPVRRLGRRQNTGLKTTNSKKLFYGFIKTKITTDPREVYLD